MHQYRNFLLSIFPVNKKENRLKINLIINGIKNINTITITLF